MKKRATVRARLRGGIEKVRAAQFGTRQIVTGGLVVLVLGVALGANTDVWNDALRALRLKPNVPEINLSSLQATYETLADNYDGTLDTAKLVDGANHGLVAAVNDPYTVYFSKSEAQGFSDELEGSFQGIGAALTLKNGVITVASVLDNSPAKSAGVAADDVVVAVDGQSTQGWSIDKAVGAIRGKAGTDVKLSIVRGDAPVEITVTRAALTDPSVTSTITDGIGVMRISRFGDNDTADLAAKAADSFSNANVKGVILDLRANGGGYVSAARDICNLWLKDKLIVTEKARGKTVDTIRSGGDPILGGVPTIVLIDGGSASASEITAGALRDNGAATLYGQQSYGKGVAQNIFPLAGGAEIKVTTTRWYTPKGNNINGTGLAPDVTITPTDAQLSAGEDVVKSAALAKLAG